MSIAPDEFSICIQRGMALQKEAHLSAAESIYKGLLEKLPNNPLVLHLLGTVVGQQGRWFEAIDLLQRSLRIYPLDPKAWNNLAIAFLDAGDYVNAKGAAERALSLSEGYVAAKLSLAGACYGLGHCIMAVDLFKQVAVGSGLQYVAWPGVWRSASAICDWASVAEAMAAIDPMLADGKMVLSPFDALAYADGPYLHQKCAQDLMHETAKREAPVPFDFKSASASPVGSSKSKIRIAYLSADFHEHATAYLMAGVFESHDRSRFEVFAVSFGPDDQSPMRERLKSAFDHFWDVRMCTHEDIAQKMRDAEVDIAVDLKGFTRDGRPSIFLFKPAPVVVSYLGYPGTMGWHGYDYVIGDSVVTPSEHQGLYSEKIVQMPASYQCNDRKRPLSESRSTRFDEGLPEAGFVFAAFNNTYKFTPVFFDAWMRLLKAVDGSVLWIVASDEVVRANLEAEAKSRGVDSGRLIFAKRVSLEDHLARHAHADLLLDNLPYNAHTTTSDALWAGVPVVTCMGQAFAGRVAASLLNAVGLSELVTHSVAEYEALALRLATNPSELQRLRSHLQSVRFHAPLFDTERFTQHLETAYLRMHERRLMNLPAEGFAVEAHPEGCVGPLRPSPLVH